MALDITISPLYRINGQENPTMPGLLALNPPRNAARGRDQDGLVVYLLLTGNSVFTTREYMQVAEGATKVFFATPGSLTNALRVACESINKSLLDRNMETSSRGQYALGWLSIAAIRETQMTFLLSGPVHAYHFGMHETRHIFEPNVSGKGLGMNRALNIYYAQATLQLGDRLLFCGKVPNAWETPLNDSNPSSLAAMRRRLTSITSDDLNAVLMQTSKGSGSINLLSGNAEIKDEKVEEGPTPPAATVTPPRRVETPSAPQADPSALPAHLVQPSAYAIPPQQEERSNEHPDPLSNLPRSAAPGQRGFPASIPRAGSQSILSNESNHSSRRRNPRS